MNIILVNIGSQSVFLFIILNVRIEALGLLLSGIVPLIYCLFSHSFISKKVKLGKRVITIYQFTVILAMPLVDFIGFLQYRLDVYCYEN